MLSGCTYHLEYRLEWIIFARFCEVDWVWGKVLTCYDSWRSRIFHFIPARPSPPSSTRREAEQTCVGTIPSQCWSSYFLKFISHIALFCPISSSFSLFQLHCFPSIKGFSKLFSSSWQLSHRKGVARKLDEEGRAWVLVATCGAHWPGCFTGEPSGITHAGLFSWVS